MDPKKALALALVLGVLVAFATPVEAGKYMSMKGPKKRAGNSVPCSGSLTGTGPMYVIVMIPFGVPIVSASLASIQYRINSTEQNMTARDGTQTGFDVTKTSTSASGSIYLAGAKMPADKADAGSSCDSSGKPCHIVGYAQKTVGLQVWTVAELDLC